MRPAARRSTLLQLHAAAVAGAHPGPAVAAALASCPLPEDGAGVHLLAVGKAAYAMSGAAVDALAARGVTPAGGLVVAHHEAPAGIPARAGAAATLTAAVGDHPIPGVHSARAADLLGTAAGRVGVHDLAVVLLSGGASALVGASTDPDAILPADFAHLSRTLLGAGLPIDVVNAVRRRVSRWGGGKLARALMPARVLCLALSDVPGDDPAVIGSGPCSPDPTTAGALLQRLRELLPPQHFDAVPAAVRRYLEGADRRREGDAQGETPKPGAPEFAGVRWLLAGGNADARRAAADAARALGSRIEADEAWLDGEAARAGRALADAVLAAPPGTVRVWGGEPWVTLDPATTPPDARGGRMQELALAAAATFYAAGPRADGVALLAAGTDGRDGPTDAAGALVDGATWAAITAAGRDPAADLAAHRSHDALGAAGALLPAAPTGTNVADVVIAIRG